RSGAESTVFMRTEEYQTAKEEDVVDVSQIRELIRALEDSNVDEVVIEEDGTKISLRKGTASYAPPALSTFPTAAPMMTASAAPAPGVPAEAEGARPDSWKAVTSPMVGTFYEAGSPGADPFVSVGDEVAAGATLCIVE